MQIPSQFVFPKPEGYRGHPHFWERAINRRQFMGATALAGGAVLSAPLWSPLVAQAATRVDPKPIPQTIAPGAPFHLELLGAKSEPSTITDFRGIVGGADLLGRGFVTEDESGKEAHLWTAIDNRFMQGTYVGVDGIRHRGTLAFV
jgi:hypothetical protein